MRGDRLGLALALVEELLDALACRLYHRIVFGNVGLLGEPAMADNDLGLVVGELEPVVCAADHAPDVAAVGEVDLLVTVAIVHDVAGADHVGVTEIDPAVAVGMGIVDMVYLGLAAADLDG